MQRILLHQVQSLHSTPGFVSRSSCGGGRSAAPSSSQSHVRAAVRQLPHCSSRRHQRPRGNHQQCRSPHLLPPFVFISSWCIQGARNSCSPLVTAVSMQQLPLLLLLKLILLEVCFAGSSVILWPTVLDLSVAGAEKCHSTVALPRCHLSSCSSLCIVLSSSSSIITSRFLHHRFQTNGRTATAGAKALQQSLPVSPNPALLVIIITSSFSVSHSHGFVIPHTAQTLPEPVVVPLLPSSTLLRRLKTTPRLCHHQLLHSFVLRSDRQVCRSASSFHPPPSGPRQCIVVAPAPPSRRKRGAEGDPLPPSAPKSSSSSSSSD